jgi:hypothetical protein
MSVVGNTGRHHVEVRLHYEEGYVTSCIGNFTGKVVLCEFGYLPPTSENWKYVEDSVTRRGLRVALDDWIYYTLYTPLGTTCNTALSLIYTIYSSPIHTHYDSQSSLVVF